MRDKYAEKITAHLVQLLLQERKKKKLSHQALADAAGIHRSTISLIENGKRVPTIVMCLKISKALGVSLAKLLEKADRL